MASLLGGGSTGEGGIAPVMVDSISMRKTWAILGLLASGRVGSTDDEIRSTTWVSFSKGRMGSTGVNGSTTCVTLSNGRVGSTEDGIRSTYLVSLSEGVIGKIYKCEHELVSLDPPRSRTKKDRT
jgi:hypothetical protein